jgi:hypothetical protein
MITFIILLLLFQLKHLVFDWLYQPPWQYKNKGTYGAFGGIFHATQHAFPTFLILLWPAAASLHDAAYLAIIEGVIHYHIDWAKMNINRIMSWGPTTSENFWRLTGVDQFLHQATYAWLIYMVTQ